MKVVKVISNFTSTNITGTSITGGTNCAATCYLTLSSIATTVNLSANSFYYIVNIQGLLSTVIFNPLLTLT
jgi:hypothetical protein